MREEPLRRKSRSAFACFGFVFVFFLHETQTQSASGNVVSKHSCGHFTPRRRVLGFSNRASEDLAGSCGQGHLILLIASRGGRTWAACRNQENEEKALLVSQ